jgi:hypothetical protein
MLGRRSHARVSIATGAAGVLSLARDVAVHVNDDGQFIAISREPGVLGETVLVTLADEDVNVLVEVIESKPMITDGAVRHRLWLRQVNADRDVSDSDQHD